MPDKLDANEQHRLLGELQALRSVLEGAQPAGGSAAVEPPLLNDIVTGDAPGPATGMLPDSSIPAASALSDAHAADMPAADAAPVEAALELQFGLDDPDWNQFVDQVFSEHQDLAADHNGPGRSAGASKRELEQSRDAMLLEELTRNLDARLARLRQTLLVEIKDMLQRRGRLR